MRKTARVTLTIKLTRHGVLPKTVRIPKPIRQAIEAGFRDAAYVPKQHCHVVDAIATLRRLKRYC